MLEQPRFNLTEMNPEVYRHLMQMEALIARNVEPTLYHLIKLRASQINGCAFCLQMHTAEALKHGETPERMMALDAWEESPLFTDKDPVLHKNKQAAMHIVIDLLAYGHWNEADKWLTERYIQHNPGFASGREALPPGPVVAASNP